MTQTYFIQKKWKKKCLCILLKTKWLQIPFRLSWGRGSARGLPHPQSRHRASVSLFAHRHASQARRQALQVRNPGGLGSLLPRRHRTERPRSSRGKAREAYECGVGGLQPLPAAPPRAGESSSQLHDTKTERPGGGTPADDPIPPGDRRSTNHRVERQFDSVNLSSPSRPRCTFRPETREPC